MPKPFSYQEQTYRIQIQLNKIARHNKGYKDLKSLLLKAKVNGYLASNIDRLKANQKSDRKELLLIADTFCNLKLVTQKTIKTRGWTDKLIKENLAVDIWAENPYYKTSGDMKLYCLSKVVALELDPTIAKAIAKNLIRRQKLANTKQQRILSAPFKWLSAIGDPFIALALLLRLLNKAIKSIKDYKVRQDFYKLKDKILVRFKRFLVKTFIARQECFDNRKLYCHWFNINGYKVSFHSYQALGYTGNLSLEQYKIKFGSKLTDYDRKLLFKLSGWQSINEALEGLRYLSIRDFLGKFEISKNLYLFSPPKYPEPPNEDDLFVLKINREHEYMKINFDKIIKEIRTYQSNSCPLDYNCKQMGAVNDLKCLNYQECTKTFYNFNRQY